MAKRKPLFLNSSMQLQEVAFDDFLDNQLSDSVSYISSTGVLSGCVLELSSDPTKFKVSDGFLKLVDIFTDPANPESLVIPVLNLPEITPDWSLFASGRHSVYVTLDKNLNVRQTVSRLSNQDYSDYFYLGIVSANFTTHQVSSVYPYAYSIHNVSTRLQQFFNVLGCFNDYGNVYLPSADTPPTLKLQRTSGAIFRPGSNYVTNPKDRDHALCSALNNESFMYTRHSSGAWVYGPAPSSSIDPQHYDNLTDLVDITGTGKFTIQTVFFSPSITFIQYGQVLYDSLQEAKDHYTDAFQVYSILEKDFVFRAWIVVKEGCTDLNDTSKCLFLAAGMWGLAGSVGASSGGISGGEVNTASNVGTLGLGLFKQKSGVDLQFLNIAPGSSKISIVGDNEHNAVKIDVHEAGLSALASAVTLAPANPSNITSTSFVHFGLGGTLNFTPLKTGKIRFTIRYIGTVSGGSNASFRLCYGTAAAPVNGAAASGTVVGVTDQASPGAVSLVVYISRNVVISGLSIGVNYWFDVQGLKPAGNQNTGMSNIEATFEELPY